MTDTHDAPHHDAPPQVTVTVLIPVYNSATYLLETLRSVSSQTFRDFELLAVDDGSQDESAQMLASYALTEPRLRVIRQPNGGISSALNTGLAAARGRYVARLDADDVMLPDRLAVQVAFLDAHPELGFCSCAMDMINSRSEVFAHYSPLPVTQADLEGQLARREAIVFTHPTVTMRTELALRVGGYQREFEPCEDMELFSRMMLAGQPGLVLPQTLLRYRVHAQSVSGSGLERQIRQQEFVRARFYARRAGGNLDRAAYEHEQATLPWLKRWRARAWLRAEVHRRAARYRLAEGKRFKALMCMGQAAAWRPFAALGAVIRAPLRALA